MNFNLSMAILIAGFSYPLAYGQEMVIGKIDTHPITVGSHLVDQESLVNSVERDLRNLGVDPKHLSSGEYLLKFDTLVPRVRLIVDANRMIYRWSSFSTLLEINPIDLPDLVFQKMIEKGLLSELKKPTPTDLAKYLLSELAAAGLNSRNPAKARIKLKLGCDQAQIYLNIDNESIEWGYFEQPILSGPSPIEILNTLQKAGYLKSSSGSDLIIFQGDQINTKKDLKTKKSTNEMKESKKNLEPKTQARPIFDAGEFLASLDKNIGQEDQKFKQARSDLGREGGVGNVPGAPLFSDQQLNEIFSQDNKLQVSVIWDKGPYNRDEFKARDRDTLEEASKTFRQLANFRLFSLAFADLYSIDRKTLNELVNTLLPTGYTINLRLFFQRIEQDANYFGNQYGDGPPTTKESEAYTREVNYIWGPKIGINLALYKGSTEIRSVKILAPTVRLYGGENDKPLYSFRAITLGIVELAHWLDHNR